jgi:hypothetical protein
MKVPVYLFLGMLDAGKTSFIEKTLSGCLDDTNRLLIMCEDGEKTYSENIHGIAEIISIEKPEQFTREALCELDQKYQPQQVFIEYNGMWPLSAKLPESWEYFQKICLIDATTFTTYITNMPQQIMEKIMAANMVLLNRCTRELAETVRSRNLRIVNRRAEFYLEYEDGTIENYKQEGLLMLDLTQPVITVPDEDYSLWYVEFMDNLQSYAGKTIRIKGMIRKGSRFDPYVMIGRWIMTCCEKDMQYFGIALDPMGLEAYSDGEWAEVTGTIHKVYLNEYEGMGPMMEVQSAKRL